MAKGESRESRLRAGIERLRALGLDPGSSSIGDLEAARNRDPEVAMAVAAVLAERASDESVVALRRLENAAGADKELRREARRSLYRLSQRGVSVAERQAPPVAAPPPIFAAARPEGYLSASDPAGDRLLWILKARPGGGIHHLSTVVNEPGGLKEAVLAEVSRKSVRRLRQELEQGHGLRLFEADWRYCDWIASEGYERARARGTLGPAGSQYPQLRMQLFPNPAEPAPPPIERHLDRVGEADPTSLSSSDELFREPDFQYWFLPEPALAPYLARYAELRDSPIVLDRPQQMVRLDEIVADARREIFSGEGAASWRRRLEEAAYMLWKSGREEAARRAYAAAVAVGTSQSGGTGIPFFEELTRRSFGLFFARAAEKEREERAGSVIVTPDQLREEQSRKRRR